MKILEQQYPLGTLKGQKTPGRYINETLYENLKILAKTISKDMTFLGICASSTLENGTGKSVFMQQIGEAYSSLVNQFQGTNLTFGMQNIVFNPEDLIERAFKVPRYSCIILDEWEDQHYWSKLGISLRQFFRKCRQLNLFIIVIIPNFFQLPINYAISRSVFFIDVQFKGEFDRGYFSFYNYERKKDLYLKGKKFHEYRVIKPNFTGRFADGYAVPEDQYRKAKYKDMIDDAEKKKPLTEKQIKVALFKKIHERLPEITIKRLAEGFGVVESTAHNWLNEAKEDESLEKEAVAPVQVHYTSYPIRTNLSDLTDRPKTLSTPAV